MPSLMCYVCLVRFPLCTGAADRFSGVQPVRRGSGVVCHANTSRFQQSTYSTLRLSFSECVRIRPVKSDVLFCPSPPSSCPIPWCWLAPKWVVVTQSTLHHVEGEPITLGYDRDLGNSHGVWSSAWSCARYPAIDSYSS